LQCDDSSAAGSGKGARHPRYEVLSVDSMTELERKKSSMMLMGLQSSSKSSQEIQTPQEADVDAEDSGKMWLIIFSYNFQFSCSIVIVCCVPSDISQLMALSSAQCRHDSPPSVSVFG